MSDNAGSGVNVSGTGEKIGTPLTQGSSLNVPADFTLYQTRRDLIAKRSATADPIRRERINVLIEQLGEYDRATGQRRLEIGARIAAQMQLMAS